MIYVGCDISKKTLDVFFIQNGKHYHLQFSNTPMGIKALLKRLPPDAFIIFESTGAYTKLLYKTLCDNNVPCCCCNPLTIRRFAQGMGFLAKTDRIDSKVLYLYGEKTNPKKTQFKDDINLELNELLYVKDALLKEIQSLRNRLEQPFVCEDVGQILHDAIKALQEKLLLVEKKIEDFMKRNPVYAEKARRLTTIIGVGLTTAYAFLAYGPELGTLSRNQVKAIAGLAPKTRKSGSSHMRETIGGGRAHLRKACYMPALVAIKCDPFIRGYYEGYIKRGKAKKMGIVAVMAKLLVRANSLLKEPVNSEKQNTPILDQKVA